MRISDSSLPVGADEYKETRYALQIADTYMEPFILKGDYCIFEKTKPQDQDIVVLHFPSEENKATIRIWRQNGKDIAIIPSFSATENYNKYSFPMRASAIIYPMP